MTTKKNTIYTNVARNLDDNTVWWEGLDTPAPTNGLDWQNHPWNGQAEQAKKAAGEDFVKGAHPNSRFTAPAENCPSIAPEFLEVTNAVLDEAEKIFGKIDRMVLFPLADHIAFAVKRIQNHEQISNPLTEDIRVLFHMEFKAAESIRPLLQKQFGIDIEDDEVGYVALHIHSAIEDEKVSQAMQMARSVRECISMVEEAIGKPIDIASLSYNRLMNHIRYMVARALSGEKLKVNMNDYMEVKFPESFGMAQAVCDQVGESLGVKLEEVETGYLAMHIERVANDEREIEE